MLYTLKERGINKWVQAIDFSGNAHSFIKVRVVSLYCQPPEKLV